MHSSQYKYPEKHDLVGKKVLVVGIGNSGLDVVTEVAPVAKQTYLVSRSGAYVTNVPHGDWSFASGVGDRLLMGLFLTVPWFISTVFFERGGLMMQSDMKSDQAILNKHGLKPKHRFWQQHTLFTGLNGRHTLHEELESGNILVRHGIEKFTKGRRPSLRTIATSRSR